MSLPKPSQSSRRKFVVQNSAILFAGTTLASSSHSAESKDRFRLASIGVGGMGNSDLGSLSSHPKVDVVALCDVDSKNLAAASEKHPKAKLFRDYRKMLEEFGDSIDGVSVSTPDHTHAAAAVAAMNLGKHVYCQKPLTHDVYEARQMRLIAEKTGVVTQMGTQIHSTTPYRTAAKLIQSGAIGKVSEVHSWSSKTWGYEGPAPEPAPVPEFLDWNLWLGTAEERPYAQGHYHPGNWRRWNDFGCGTMGDMAIHILDPVFTALQLGSPKKIISLSPAPPEHSYGLKNQTVYTFPSTAYTTDQLKLTWSDGGTMPDSSKWPLPKFAPAKKDEKEPRPYQLPDQGSMFVGEKGYMLLPHVDMPKLFPEDTFARFKYEPAENGNHYHLWVDACLGGKPTTANFGYAGPLTEAVLLGVLANRFPQNELLWDAEKIAITNHEPSNKLLRRKYRSGWEVKGLS